MTFSDEIIDSYRRYKDIDKPSFTKKQLYLHADFIELIALFSNEDGVTKGDILDRFFGTKDYKNASERDIDEIFVDNIINVIHERIILFSKDYPFLINDISSFVMNIKTKLNWKNKLYLSLLISSNLNIFKRFQTILTNEFETFSSEVLKKYLPNFAKIKEFGINTEYKGNAQRKIKMLAADIGIATDDYELECIEERNTKERGLDIIGWIPFSDNCQNKNIFLVQCACGKNTESKFHDTRRFENYLRFYKTVPQHTMFIPYSLINPRMGKFYNSDLIEKDFLIFERKRMVHFYDNKNEFELSKSLKIVNDLIEYKESYT